MTTLAVPRFQTPSASSGIVAALGALFAACFCVVLWPDWRNNPDLSHGFFAPVLFVLLLRESRRKGPCRHPSENRALQLTRAIMLAAGLAFIVLAGFFAASVEWSHPLVGLSLALALSGMLLGALLWLSSDAVRAQPLNWASLLAVGFWPLCAPIPPGTYSRITLQLQLWVTDIVLKALHLLGIPASTSGNIIQLAHTSVGVEEACSGVRSLLSCFVAALFFSATLVQGTWRRVFLVALAPPLAFGMNIVRSLTLTLLANAGVDIGGGWHDLTGFAVLAITAMVLGVLALWLEEPAPTTAAAPVVETPPLASRPRVSSHPWGLFSAYGVACVLVGFFVLNTHGPSKNPGPPPDMQALLPRAPDGWDHVYTEDLFQFSSVLATEHLVQRTYLRRSADPARGPVQITLYLAYWAAGQAPVSLVSAHTPDACWPGAGWRLQPSKPTDAPFLSGEHRLPPPEYRAFTNAELLQHVWYWHLYDGASITQTDPRSAGALLKLAWNYGFRTAGEQMFVRVSSNRPWSEIRDEPLLVEILAGLEPFGLREQATH